MLDLLVCNRVLRIFASELTMENSCFFFGEICKWERIKLIDLTVFLLFTFYTAGGLHVSWCRSFLKDYV